MGSNAIISSSISDAVRHNVAEVRQRRRMSQQGLADRMAQLGRSVRNTAIAKIESGQRRVDVDDLVALAAALNVSPARLLLPDEGDPLARVQLTPEVEVGMEAAWQWVTGSHSLESAEADLADPAVQRAELEFGAERPLWLRTMQDNPLYQAARHLEWTVRVALHGRGGPEGRNSAVAFLARLDQIKRSLTMVESQIDALREQESQP